MTIGIDVSAAQRMHGGITEYVYRLLEAMALLASPDEFALFSTHDLVPGKMEPLPPLPANFHLYPLRFVGRIRKQTWRYLGWPRATSVLPPVDVFFAPHILVPPGQFRRLVVTVHDILFEDYPEWFGQHEAARFRWALRNALERADALIAVSDYTKQQLVDRFNVPAERITTIPHGVAYQPPTAADWQRAQQRYQLPSEYLLVLGAVEDRKNISRILTAYESVARHGTTPKLVLAGQRGRLDSATAKQLEHLSQTHQIQVIGRFAHEDRSAILSHARLLLAPSLAEGFGLPVLEGFAAGIPVITSTTTSLPEVAGSAAVLVNPEQTAEIAGAIQQLLTDDGLRERLVTAGRARAKQFSWTTCARDTLKVLTAVAGQKAPHA